MSRRAIVGLLLLVGGLISFPLEAQESLPFRDRPAHSTIHFEVGDAAVRSIRGLNDSSPGDQKVEAALERIVTLRCREVRLDALAAEIETRLGIPVRLATGDRPEERADPEMKVTIEVYGVPLVEALQEVDHVGFVIHKGTLVVTSDIPCFNAALTRIYPVGKLQPLGMQRLMELIKSETSGPWDSDEPGTGTIQALGDALVVRQDAKNHREIETLLDLLVRAEIKTDTELPKPAEAPRPAEVPASGSGGGLF